MRKLTPDYYVKQFVKSTTPKEATKAVAGYWTYWFDDLNQRYKQLFSFFGK